MWKGESCLRPREPDGLATARSPMGRQKLYLVDDSIPTRKPGRTAFSRLLRADVSEAGRRERGLGVRR